MTTSKTMKLHLKIWRQKGPNDSGHFDSIEAPHVSPDMSFLEMIDEVNQDLIKNGKDPIAFDHDCREGICGSCAMTINGNPHGPDRGTATCQLHMRRFKDGETVIVEPFRAKAFPVNKDLSVDRSAFDRIISAGGFVSVNTGNARDANNLPVPKEDADRAFDAAACIGCGACVAACKNASAMLFTSAKISQLSLLPQGKVEQDRRVRAMVAQMDAEGFGSCTNTGACEAACPKEITLENMARMNRQLFAATLTARPERKHSEGV